MRLYAKIAVSGAGHGKARHGKVGPGLVWRGAARLGDPSRMTVSYLGLFYGRMIIMKRCFLIAALLILLAPRAWADPCQGQNKSSFAINLTSQTAAVIQANSGNSVIYVCGYAFTLTGSTPTLQFSNAMNTPCASTTALTGTFGGAGYIGTVNVGGSDSTQFQSSNGGQLCVNVTGGAVNAQGVVTYVVRQQ